MLQSLRDLLDGTVLLLEMKALRADTRRLLEAVTRVAAALEYRNQMEFGLPRSADAQTSPPLAEIAYVDDRTQAELMDIELRLTQARGEPPTEDEILVEYERRHAPLTTPLERTRTGGAE